MTIILLENILNIIRKHFEFDKNKVLILLENVFYIAL